MTNPTHLAARRVRSSLAVAATASLVAFGVAVPLAAQADPAPATAPSSFAVGSYTGTVPDGVCAVEATIVGGAGGRAAAGANGVGSNGAAASISATFAVLPGQSISGSVGGGGKTNSGRNGGAGGANGGGAGGTAADDHGGAGGGGRSTLTIDGAERVVAGGGGGSGGGHSTSTDGFGGDAGIPTGTGAFAGASGTDGKDTPGVTPGGGEGGQLAGAGAGGVNSQSSSLNGLPGAGANGGVGGQDPNYDAGGGGGAGYFGGGGGASTVIRNTDNVGGVTINGVAGGGGGGGASYVDASALGGSVTASPAGRLTGTGAGADGSVTLDWIACAYDLAVSKTLSVDGSASAATADAPVGSELTWTIAVTNNGPDRMTRGDLLTLGDSVPGAGATEIVSIGVSGGGDAELASGAITCDAAVGDQMPTALACSRPYQILGGSVSGARGLDVGETFTISYAQTVVAADLPGLSNTATVTDRATGDADDSATATVDVLPQPEAENDSDLGNTLGEIVTVDVLANDTVTSTPATVRLIDGAGLVTEREVPGQGVWTVVGTNVVFTPEAGFLGDPDPVGYRVTDANGLFATATVTVSYVPAALDDEDLGNLVGTTVALPVLDNDLGDWDVSTLRLLDASGDPVTGFVAPGEGTWSVVGSTIVFVPESGFLGDPTSVDYEVTDVTGDTVSATVTVTYLPLAVNDDDLGNEIGTVVIVNPLANDTGDWQATSVRLVNPSTGDRVTELVVAGEGTWRVGASGTVSFTPEAGFPGSPTPVDYEVTDTTGDTVAATITVTYAPSAVDDASHGHTQGDVVTVDVLDNDSGDLVPGSVRIIDPDTADRVTELVVAGEGIWAVDPVTGELTFTPLAGYPGNPTPVDYEVTDTLGQLASAEVVVTYLPESDDDVSTGNQPGTAVTVDILGNDRGSFDPASARVVDPATGDLVLRLVVPGEGVWTVDPVTAAVTFTPESGFGKDPTPVTYQITDLNGNDTRSLVTIRYLPPTLPSTGADVTPALAGTLLLLLGLGGLLWSRRRASTS